MTRNWSFIIPATYICFVIATILVYYFNPVFFNQITTFFVVVMVTLLVVGVVFISSLDKKSALDLSGLFFIFGLVLGGSAWYRGLPQIQQEVAFSPALLGLACLIIYSIKNKRDKQDPFGIKDKLK